MFHRAPQWPNTLLNGVDTLFFWLIWKSNVFPNFQVIFGELLRNCVEATLASQDVDPILWIQVVLDQFNSSEVVSLVLLYSNFLLALVGLLPAVHHVVAIPRPSAVVVENQDQSASVPDYLVKWPFVPILILMIHQREPVNQTLRVDPDDGYFPFLHAVPIFENKIVVVSDYVVMDVDLEPVGFGQNRRVLLDLFLGQLCVIAVLVVPGWVFHDLIALADACLFEDLSVLVCGY